MRAGRRGFSVLFCEKLLAISGLPAYNAQVRGGVVLMFGVSPVEAVKSGL